MSLSFLGKKGFHPSNPKNLKKLFEAEEKKKKEDTAREELARQYKDEQERRENKGLLNKTMGVAPSTVERSGSMAFMEQLPPGMAEANERQKGTKLGTRSERDAERFPILQNAPRSGDFTKDLQVHHKPFGVELQNKKCSRCGQWGHSLGDRECPMRDVNPHDEENKARMDPLARQVGLESCGGPLRWDLKGAATGEGVRGSASSADANQQFVLGDAEDARQATRQAVLADIDPAVLAALSEKQQKKLLKMYSKELKSAAREEAGGGEKKRKHKDKKKDKHKKKKRRRGSGSSSGSDSD